MQSELISVDKKAYQCDKDLSLRTSKYLPVKKPRNNSHPIEVIAPTLERELAPNQLGQERELDRLQSSILAQSYLAASIIFKDLALAFSDLANSCKGQGLHDKRGIT